MLGVPKILPEDAIMTTHYQWRYALVLLMLLVVACGQAAQPTPGAGPDAKTPVTIRVSGAFALFPMMAVWAEAYSQQHPHVTFDLQGGGAGKGMADMLTGVADMAMLSRAPRQEELDQGAFLMPAAIDAVVATVNANNPALERLLATGLTPEKAAALWLREEVATWGALVGSDDTARITVYTRSDSSGAAEVWSLFMGGTGQEDLQGIAVNGDPGLAEAVRQDVHGIGFNNIVFAYSMATGQQIEGLRVVPLDLNGDGTITADEDFYADRLLLHDAVAAHQYPHPPARLLYLVTKGPPAPEIAAFYRWMLTEGQSLVDAAGFVGLNPASVEAGLGLLPLSDE
ncbi:MAG: phosphate ABC transporter substrate-binding protein [Candidatus Viridilinea halotolerans]|uniref:Phosphate ABC transporter substrate-binding protein n=1 Tax=Candidatus Viridilinea halotolerans TaxID=2491704 RepID=A0A426TZR6_9CHLR|nr:MAG: phosphate ABC transporter substrate-binding protein [Candidatus Viridilinea halotolerans]